MEAEEGADVGAEAADTGEVVAMEVAEAMAEVAGAEDVDVVEAVVEVLFSSPSAASVNSSPVEAMVVAEEAAAAAVGAEVVVVAATAVVAMGAESAWPNCSDFPFKRLR